MADFNKPEITDEYTAVLQEIRDNSADQAKLFADQTPTGTPTGAVRWSALNNRFEKYDGAAWQILANLYAINAAQLMGLEPGNASGNIPVSNGTLNVNLNAELLGGQTMAYFATAQGLTDLANKEALDVQHLSTDIANVNTKVDTKLAKTGDRMTGPLFMGQSSTPTLSQALYFEDSTGRVPLISNNGVLQVWNSGFDTANMQLDQGGMVTFRGPVKAPISIMSAVQGAGYPGVYRTTGNLAGAFVGWDQDRPAALQIDCPDPAATQMAVRWTRWGGRHIAAIEGYEGGSASSLPMIAFNLGAYPMAWRFQADAIYNKDGGWVWGSWNLNPATLGSTCQWATGIVEYGPIGAYQTIDMPAPYVMCGWRSTSNGNWITGSQFVRGVALKNQ